MTTSITVTPSRNGMILVAGASGSITDASGSLWTIAATDTVDDNGAAAGFTANVAELAYVNDVVWHENTAGRWYSWNGWGWTAGANPLPAVAAASASGTVVSAGSNDAITDSAGNGWTLSSGNTVVENGSAAGYTANVAEIAYVDGQVWHENTSGNWYSWTGSGWTGGSNPLPTSIPASSSSDTVVLAGSTQAITDNAGNSWTLSSGNTVVENGSAAGYTANVAEIAYVDGQVWHENTSGNWYSWTGSGWTGGSNPLSTSIPASSSSDTVVLAGSTQAITDNAGNSWTLSSGNTVLENGIAAGYTANVAEMAYANGQVWHENTSGSWYSWTGSGWAGGSNPLSTSGAPAGGAGDNSIGSSLNLTGYHLSFDWEANDFQNSPSPQSGTFTTTLSSGLRYLSNGDQEYWANSSTGQNPFQLNNGVLDINATYVGAGNTPGGGSLSYNSGVFTTQGMFSQKYGYFEMRAELPAGAGMWPAFWLLDNNSNQPGGWPPELDALEAFGAQNANGEGGPDEAHWDVHSQNASQQAGNWVNINADATTSYHTYGVLWTPEQMSFVYDGKVVAQAPTPSDYTQEMYLIVDLAVGGTWPGNATGENGTLKVDYLRAYSNNSSIPAVALQTISSPDGGGMSLYGASTLGH